MTDLALRCAENLARIRGQKPLIHNITNFVVMHSTANILLAAGASPVMAHAENEVEELVTLAGALVLNIGTLADPWVAAMAKAGKKATILGKPIVLDPVGAGATTYRTAVARQLLQSAKISVIRGNASEILALGTSSGGGKGVDSCHTPEEARQTALRLARELATTLAITGPVDLVTDGTRVVRIANGHPLMPMITGTGCAATALVGAFLAVDPDPLLAATTALAYFGVAGEMAGEKAAGPGSFAVALLDALAALTPERVAKRCRITLEEVKQ